MSFIIDKQTFDDLNIFGKRGQESIFSLFNCTATHGGAEQLESMFRTPFSDADSIRKRALTIRFFQENKLGFTIGHDLLEAGTHYLNMRDNRSQLTHDAQKKERFLKSVMRTDTEFQTIKKGIKSLLQIVQELYGFVQEIQPVLPAGHPYEEELNKVRQILEIPEWFQFFEKISTNPSYDKLILYDQLLRFRYYQEMQQLLTFISNMDVFSAVASVAEARGFVFPAIAEVRDCLQLENVFHPHLQQPIANSITMLPDKNVLFLTGANMAGKSTFMKSLGIAVFLAHMGFPIPAAAMTFSVMDGMLTTINLPDNLHMGYSHFYTEVLRAKKVTGLLKQEKRMVVLIDELFRGTNVKDAYEATVAITGKFAGQQKSFFVISSHIMEAGETLKEQYLQINFQFLPTRMNANTPVYTRKLEPGISADRHGMIIIRNEGIIEMLHQAAALSSSLYNH